MIPGASTLPVTEHTAGELGTVAVTVVSGNRHNESVCLQASGLNDLHEFIREQGYSGDVAYPGRICYDETSRQLISECLSG